MLSFLCSSSSSRYLTCDASPSRLWPANLLSFSFSHPIPRRPDNIYLINLTYFVYKMHLLIKHRAQTCPAKQSCRTKAHTFDGNVFPYYSK